MSSEKSVKLLALSLCLLPPASAQESASLRQAYDWARARNEGLKSLEEGIRQSQAQARGALGGAMPKLDGHWTGTWQDPDGVKKLEAQGFGGFVEKKQVESKLSLKQPLFSGLREWNAWAAFRRQTARDQALFQRAARQLFQRTADAYYDLLDQEAARDNAAAALDLSRDRLKELREFLKLGKARQSEVYTAEAREANLAGQLERINGRIAFLRGDLSLLTGRDFSRTLLNDDLSALPSTGSLDDELASARERSDLRAQREELEGQKLRVRFEKGARWPTADVTGNYYGQRPAFMKDLAWDVVLAVQLPIFRGGTISANVRQAESARARARLALEELERAIVHEVRQLHDALDAALRESRALDAAAKAARKSYDALRKEYRLGLVTNLEVLEALDFLQAQENALDSARVNAKRLAARLGVAVEKLP